MKIMELPEFMADATNVYRAAEDRTAGRSGVRAVSVQRGYILSVYAEARQGI